MQKMSLPIRLFVLFNIISLNLAGCAVDRASAPAPSETRTDASNSGVGRDELERRTRAGPTPLDAFTAFGKREFLAGLEWDAQGEAVAGLSTTALIRELRGDQIIALLTYLGMKDLGISIAKSLPPSEPLRFPEPDGMIEREWKRSSRLFDAQAQSDGNSAQTTDISHADAITHYRSALAPRMSEGALRVESLGNLMLLFDTAAAVSMRSADATAGHDMRAVFSELERRHVDTRRGFDHTMLSALLAAGQFDQAREFLSRHPDPQADEIPKILDPLGPTFAGRSVLDLDPATKVLKRVAVPATASAQIIMLVGPGCHFSRDALSEIARDPALLERLRQRNIIVLTPPGASLELASIGAWNTQHAQLPMRIPWDRKDWKDIDRMQVPQFLIFDNGKLVQRIVGWKGNQALLNEALDARELRPLSSEQQ